MNYDTAHRCHRRGPRAGARVHRGAAGIQPSLAIRSSLHTLMSDDLAGQTPRPPRPPAGNPATPPVGPNSPKRGGEHGLRGGAGEPATSPGTTRPPDATRYLDTTRGVLSYQQLAPFMAERVGDLEARIVTGEFSGRRLDDKLVRDFHRSICGDLVPDWAGAWQSIAVVVGEHHPPLPHEVPLMMRNYGANLGARWEDACSRDNERLLEMLAFAEGRLLSIHPFRDFNGRVTRVSLREILRRLGVPGISLAPTEPAARLLYLESLAAADQQDYHPLVNLWKDRIEASRLS